MIIGLDFDNTLVDYGTLFHEAAASAGLLPPGFPEDKTSVRDYLRAQGRNDLWTFVQAQVYGPLMSRARPFDGALDFLVKCRRSMVPAWIVSHKTRRAAAGGGDLRGAAWRWLGDNGFLDGERAGLSPARVFFCETRAEKAARIAECGCTHFIDDLPEVFLEPNFPDGVERVLFSPVDDIPRQGPWRVVRSWAQASAFLFPCQ